MFHPDMTHILCVLIGAFIGHRFTLWRDFRNDFNSAADDLFSKLAADLGDIDICPGFLNTGMVDLAQFWRRLRWWQRGRFGRAVEHFKQVCENVKSDQAGQVHFVDKEKVYKALEVLVGFTNRR